MSMWNEKWFLEEVKTSESQKSKLLREWFAQKNVWQYLDWPRRTRRSKLLPSWKSMKGKTKLLRKKYRNVGNTKTLVASK